MNLAFITRRYGRIGGTERDLHELTVRLVARGHEVHIYCCEVRMDPPAGIHVHRVPREAPVHRRQLPPRTRGLEARQAGADRQAMVMLWNACTDLELIYEEPGVD